MSAHSSHTDAGTSPTRISNPNTWQPRQTAKIDSRPAATTNSAENHVGRGVVAENQPEHERGGRHHRPHPLREALRRPGYRLLRAEPGRDHVLGRPAERAQRRPGQDPRPESVGERDQQPVRARGQDYQHRDQDDAGDHAGRLLVDRVRKRKQPRHHFQYKRPEFMAICPGGAYIGPRWRTDRSPVAHRSVPGGGRTVRSVAPVNFPDFGSNKRPVRILNTSGRMYDCSRER